MSTEEKHAREHRRRNLDYVLKIEATTPQHLARKLVCETNYISQLRNGFRPITFNTARLIEDAARLTRLSLDNPETSNAPSVTQVTDSELADLVASDVKDKCKTHGKPTRGEMFDAMVRLCLLDAHARGYSKGRVDYIVEEFLK